MYSETRQSLERYRRRGRKKNKGDLIVVATHGRHGLSKLVLGSNAEAIFGRATCPVLRAGPNVGFIDEQAWQPKKIVFATDFSASLYKLCPMHCRLLKRTRPSSSCLHLSSLIPLEVGDDIEAGLVKRLQDLVRPDAANWCKPECIVRFEFPAEGILRTTEEFAADLIVMSVRRSAIAGAASHLPWAIASEVVSRARCPVLRVCG
jgi:nucleotide-binding universal stress UspA family protein